MIFGDDAAQSRLKWAFDSCKNGAWGEEPDGQSDAVCVRAADFNSDLGLLLDSERTLRAIDDATYRKVGLRAGDLVIEKSGGGEKQLVGRSVIYRGTERAVCSNFLARCRPSDLVTSEYLNFLMLGIYKARGTYPHIKQTTGIQNLDMASFLNTRVTLPPIETQKRIAAFLDEKTAQIDALIARKQALLARLAEKRQAIITQAATKGLNPAAPLKDSGIDWLGQIPTHWEVRGITKCTTRIDYRGATPEKSPSGVFLVTARNIKGGRIDYSLSSEFIPDDDYEHVMRRGKPETGDVLFTTEAPLGEIATIDRTGIALAQRIIKFRNSIDELNNYYLSYWMQSSSFQFDLQSRATGSTALGLKASKIVELRCLLPPIDEQKAIVLYINQQLSRIDAVKDEVGRSVRHLNEYRSALITGAVTGQMEV